MINVIFGRQNVKDGFVLDSRFYFKRHRSNDWFNNDIIRRALSVVDHCEFDGRASFCTQYGNWISAEELSTGVKTLCCINNAPSTYVFNATQMGDNCIEYYVDIAKTKDFTLCYEHLPLYFDHTLFDSNIFYSDGKLLTYEDFKELYRLFCFTNEEFYRVITENDYPSECRNDYEAKLYFQHIGILKSDKDIIAEKDIDWDFVEAQIAEINKEYAGT